VDAELDDQELMTVISKPAFWEGRCAVRGTREGAGCPATFAERSRPRAQEWCRVRWECSTSCRRRSWNATRTAA
jgi:hypothetical protein